jgi:hypothetical protein
MWFSSWLRNGTRNGPGPHGRRHQSPRQRAACRLTLEALEDRWLPSTLTVTSIADSGKGSLRDAIAAADNGDKIVFAHRLDGQTITLASQLAVTMSLDIEGPGAAKLTVSGNNASRVFDIGNNATVTIAGLTIANGRVVDDKGGGIANEAGATLHLIDDVVTNNTAYGIGGGLWNAIGATVTISNSKFDGNKALGSLTFSYSEEGFALGSGSAEGGAIDTDGTATVRDSTFTDNRVEGATGGTSGLAHGGAIGADGSLTVTGSTFTGNLARAGDGSAGAAGVNGGSGGQAEGGALAVFEEGGTVSHCLFKDNEAFGGNGGAGGTGANGGAGGSAQGGAVGLVNGTLTLEHSTFSDNQATGGTGGSGGSGGNGGAGGAGQGGVFVHTVNVGTATPLSNLNDVTMRDNQATGGRGGEGGAGGNGGAGGAGQGGAIRAQLGTINVSHSRLLDNEAAGGVGGVAGAGGAHGGNGGAGQGGALIETFGITVNVSDTVLRRNEAKGGAGAAGGNGGAGQGGAIFNGGPSPFGAPSLTLTHNRIVDNEADGGAAGAGGSAGQGVGGGVYVTAGGTASKDRATVIKHNHASTSDDNVFGTITED